MKSINAYCAGMMTSDPKNIRHVELSKSQWDAYRYSRPDLTNVTHEILFGHGFSTNIQHLKTRFLKILSDLHWLMEGRTHVRKFLNRVDLDRMILESSASEISPGMIDRYLKLVEEVPDILDKVFAGMKIELLIDPEVQNDFCTYHGVGDPPVTIEMALEQNPAIISAIKIRIEWSQRGAIGQGGFSYFCDTIQAQETTFSEWLLSRRLHYNTVRHEAGIVSEKCSGLMMSYTVIHSDCPEWRLWTRQDCPNYPSEFLIEDNALALLRYLVTGCCGMKQTELFPLMPELLFLVDKGCIVSDHMDKPLDAIKHHSDENSITEDYGPGVMFR